MKHKYLYIIAATVLLMMNEISAQVGIGTTTPDASSMLDITSTTKGLLAPRMTTIEKNVITAPANGLLVYDTDMDKFNYFDGTSWVILEAGSSISRTNYKLVKSVADLSDELAAGGGATYLLNSSYLYEINGTILIDFPIDINEAYVRGQDTRGDILFNNTGTALFTGSKGGNLRDFLVVGNGQPAFNINGTTDQNLVSNSVVYTSCSSVGTLSNMGLVFFNISQFVSCNGGLTVSNIASFLMSNIFWTSTSTGTFLSFSGTFDDIQLSSGRVSVDSGEIGIDVSANPIVNNAGSINGVAFTGAGNRINGYTSGTYPGYKFSKEWDVNSPGILVETDNNATGTIYISSKTITSIPAANTPVKALGTTTAANVFRFDTNGVSNRLRYVGTKTRIFNISASLSLTSTTNNQVLSIYFAKNGTVLNSTRIQRKIGTGADIGAASISGTVELATGDYIELWLANNLASRDATIENLNLHIN